MFALRHAGVLLLACLVLSPLEAAAWDRGNVEKFATLPTGFGNPEGITVDKNGDVHVTTFAVTAAPGTPGQLFVFGSDGHLKRQVSIAGSSNLLLGLEFHPETEDLLVIDFGNAQVLRVNSNNGRSRLFASIPGGPGTAGANALAFDRQGNVYISDSFQGIIWRTGPRGGTPVAWAADPLLRTSGTPPFGANGMDFNKAESVLFVANTGDDRIIRIPVTAGTAGTATVFVNSVNGADGLFLDEDDNVWVTANQADEMVVIDKTGRVIAKLGDFGGLDASGAPIGLLFPASPARHRGFVYITNLALDLRLFGLPQAVDSQWAADVRSHTISRIRAVIPPVPR
jgi:sugar lactone lactonase YvrE